MQDDLVKRRTCGFLAATATAAILLGAQAPHAQDSGPTVKGDVCMQHVFGDPVTNANRLNCTANDVQISRAVEVDPESCIEGETFDLEATFEIIVTANSRYEPGFFFRIDGGDNARGDGANADGVCSLSKLNNPNATTPPSTPGLNLDGDTCGDLNSGTYLATFTIPGVLCEGVPDPEDPDQLILKLPNCTSWHNNQGTVCNINGNASNFSPDTKSKCVCDDDFTVPVIVETATITVIKTATPTSVDEPGGDVTYTVSVTNDAQNVSVTIETLVDDPFGDLTDDANNDNISNSTCGDLVGVVLGPGDTEECTFDAFVAGEAGDSVEDVVEVCTEQDPDDPLICDDDDAVVTIDDVSEEPSAEKAAMLAGCTVEVNYTVTVENNSDFDDLTVDSLIDDQFGDLQDTSNTAISDTTCDELTSVAADSFETCTFTAVIDDADCTFSHVDTVNATGEDDDGVPFDIDTNPVTVSVSGVTINPAP